MFYKQCKNVQYFRQDGHVLNISSSTFFTRLVKNTMVLIQIGTDTGHMQFPEKQNVLVGIVRNKILEYYFFDKTVKEYLSQLLVESSYYYVNIKKI